MVLTALQHMFAALQNSARSSFNPLPFCAQFMDRAGMPVDPSIQKDANQYLHKLIKKLNVGLRDSSDPTLVQDTLRGTVVQQALCQGCRTIKGEQAPFFALTLKVGANARAAPTCEFDGGPAGTLTITTTPRPP